MMIKVIGIGNRLMGDDGVALKVIDAIEEKLIELSSEIKCLKAETDFDYAIDNIEDGDTIFILDSSLLGVDIGKVSRFSFEEGGKFSDNASFIHNISLVSLINSANLKVNGFIIAIEVKEIIFSLEVSESIQINFKKICSEVYDIIKEQIKIGEDCA